MRDYTALYQKFLNKDLLTTTKEEKENVLQNVKIGIAPTLEILEKTLVNGTPQ